MSSVICEPLPFTVVSASQQTIAPASNANTDIVGLVYRMTGTSGQVTLLFDGRPFDTIALVKTNARASATVRIRAGSSQAVVDGTSAPLDRSFAAWSGYAPLEEALSLYLVEATSTGPYLRIDITDTGNPAGYIEIGRIVVGKRLDWDGVDIGLEHSPEDQSASEEVNGQTIFEEYRTRTSWKPTISGLKGDDFWNVWLRFLHRVGRRKGFLFVPDKDSAHVQTQAGFVRFSSTPKATAKSSDFYQLDFGLLSV